MIYKEELMIGNIVKVDGFSGFKVVRIGYLGLDVINQDTNFSFYSYYNIVDPVGLSIENITKLGFELSKDYTNNTYRIGNFFISPIGDILRQPDFNVKLQLHYGKPLTISKIRYVHELQNIYFAITGKKI